MATVDDALELLTDPAHRAAGNPAGAKLVTMNATAILDELLSRGAESDDEARRLVRAALPRIGGIDRSRLQQGGGRPGAKSQPEMVDDFRVPAASLRT